MGEVGFLHPRNRFPQQPVLELKPEREQLLSLLGGQRGHDGALVWRDGDEALGFELLQRLAQGDAAAAELLGDLLLPDGLAGADFAREDPLPQDLCGFGGNGTALDRAIHDWNDTTLPVTPAIRLDAA